MNISPASITVGGCMPAPALAAKMRFGSDLEALGADLQVDSPTILRATFGDVARGVTVANLVKDTLASARLVVAMPLTGIPFQMSTSDVVAALRDLPGVDTVVDQTFTDGATISVFAATQETVRHLQELLVDEVRIPGRGGHDGVKIEVLTDSPVEPFAVG